MIENNFLFLKIYKTDFGVWFEWFNNDIVIVQQHLEEVIAFIDKAEHYSYHENTRLRLLREGDAVILQQDDDMVVFSVQQKDDVINLLRSFV